MEWTIRENKKDNVIDQLLYSRGVSLSEKEKFLKPKLTDLYDPYLLPDMDQAVELFLKHLKSQSNIGIFADYDADGIPGGVLLKQAFDLVGLDSSIYIPTRDEGYGLSKKSIDYFISKKTKLLVTIDCGVTNVKEINYAKSKGLDVIVLDHHEPKKVMPEADALVDAKREDSKYPFREISGAAVGFKFIQAVSKKNSKINNSFLKWSLDLIGISTISDMVPLVDENRVFAKWGIEVLRQTKRAGLRALYDQAGIEKKNISSYHVGFQIGPRINAPGRMDHANHAFYLLSESDSKKSVSLAKKIEKINNNRQKEISRIIKQAVERIESDNLQNNNLIMVRGKDWPKGIVGLVASRIKEKYFRPTIVLSQDGEFSEGSARSIPGLNILSYLDTQSDRMERYGGHAQAAGLKIKNAEFENLYDELVKMANSKLSKNDLEPVLKIDLELDFKKINYNLFRQLTALEPHGVGNPRPVFSTRSVNIDQYSFVGKGKDHLKLKLSDGGKQFEAIYFNSSLDNSKMDKVENIDIAYSIDENIYNGQRNLQLNIKDIKLN